MVPIHAGIDEPTDAHRKAWTTTDDIVRLQPHVDPLLLSVEIGTSQNRRRGVGVGKEWLRWGKGLRVYCVTSTPQINSLHVKWKAILSKCNVERYKYPYVMG